MIRSAVLVSGKGTKLQSLLDSVFFGEIPELQLVAVISSDANAYALKRARNAGIDAAKGRYYSFIDSDDVVLPRFLQTLYDACEEHVSSSNFALDRSISKCRGPFAFMLMKGRLMLVVVALDSSFFAFSAASFSLCIAILSLDRSTPC